MSKQHNSRHAAWAALTVAAASVTAPMAARAGVSEGTGQEFVLPTTGATALRSFTSAQNNRGPYLLGQQQLVVGASTYTINTAAGQAYGILNKNVTPGVQDPPTSADRIVYQYHSTGSVNGIRELARAQGLLSVSAFPVSANNQLFVMGQTLNSLNGAPLTNGYNSSVGGSYNPIIAYSDVNANQAFAVSGTASPSVAPTAAGYGLGRSNAASGFTGTSFQRLTNVASLGDGATSGVATLTSRVRNESLAVVPFTVSASPGSGLDSVTEHDVRFLQAAGRLQNGANFNFVTRDIGSGTRNQSGNNVNLDPSWASGERDRRAVANYATQDVDGSNVNVAIGDETKPELDLDGVGSVNLNEHRASALARFSDKLSGSTGVRASVLSQRMSLGTLSAGDVGSRGTSSGTTSPLRVLAIDFDEDNTDGGEPSTGPVQPKAADVTEGRYQMWSASQAVTVSPDGTTVGSTNAVKGDIDDQALAGGSAGPGLARKFLNNITSSIASGPNPATAATPFDAVVGQGFIPVQIMAVDKAFDGARQVSSPRSTTPDPVTGLSEQDIWNATVGTPTGALAAALNWQSAGSHNGNVASQTYGVYDVENTSAADAPDANIKIGMTTRTFLAGDFNGDSVRDLNDVESLAQAYGNTASYLAANPTVTGTINSATNGGAGRGTLSFGLSQQQAGLLVLSDLDGDGNVVVRDSGNNVVPKSNQVALFAAAGGGNDTVAAITREDVRFFLYGATVDTSAYATAADKRQLGVRLGQLRKNAGVIRFNAELDNIGGGATALKFNRFDVNNDGVVTRADAQYVDRNVGKDYTNLDHVLGTADDLIAAELNDDDVITHVDPNVAQTFDGSVATLGNDSDFQQIRLELGSSLLDGDITFDGLVDLSDLTLLAGNYGLGADGKWSLGDFTFDGIVDLSDLTLLAGNYGLDAGGLALAGTGDRLTAFADAQALGLPVPEPTSAAVIGIGALGMLARRRRRRAGNGDVC